MDASRRVIHNGVVAVNNGMIVQIAQGAAPAGIQAKQTIDATGQVLFPGSSTRIRIFSNRSSKVWALTIG